jgi:predicted nuclease of predicted toxin-antitoxin system
MTGFLFDENLPAVSELGSALPIVHAASLGARMSDSALWEHAKRHELAIVTKDADFSQRIVLATPPPRVVHLRIGNMRRRDFEVWLKERWPRIETAAKNNKLVNVFRDRIQSVR